MEPPRSAGWFTIARFDSFRTVELSESIESAVGRTITDVTVDNSNRLAIDITLDDGSVLHLVQPPTGPDPSGRTTIWRTGTTHPLEDPSEVGPAKQKARSF
ncbi:MAG: hypothetical protein M0Z62_01465 [Actinomycetota bacterium]|nr:hypothetical protein [Actinomycetota bacterium]